MRIGMAGTVVLAVLLAGIASFADDDDAPHCAAAVKSAKVTPAQAIAIALKAAGEGAVAYEMQVEIDHGIAVYEVRICKDGRRHTVDVGCANGEVVKQSERGELRFGLYKWDKMTTSILEAMEIALEKVQGQVIEVGLTDHMGTPKYLVHVYTGSVLKELKVNSNTGQILAIEVEDDD